ncbi:MAG: hypothetical protein QM490_05080 [Candidatus Gracilibacteria bacterium]
MKIKQFLILFSLIIIYSIYSINITYGCSYKGEIDACIAANKSGTTKSIEDFVCRVGTYEEVAYQVVLDLEFKLLDEEMDLYIENLEKNKNFYFGLEKKKTFIEGINDIETKRKYFRMGYMKLCGDTIILKVQSCMEDEKVSISNTKDYFKISKCEELVSKKIEIFDHVAFAVFMLNKEQVRSDEKKTYDQGERKNYDLVLEIMMINLGYIERIWKKWPTKLANPI